MPLEQLSIGAFGGNVRDIQAKLRQHGFDLPAAEMDREFYGPGTREAVSDLQRKYGLKVSGVVDVATALTLQGPAISGTSQTSVGASRVPSANGAKGSNGARANGASQPPPTER